MKHTLTLAAGIAAAFTLGLAAPAFAHPMGGGAHGSHGGGSGHGCAQGTSSGQGYAQGASSGQGYAQGASSGQGCAHGAGSGPLAQLFTAEERTAHQEQMRNAATPEQRSALMEAHRAQVQKRAAEKGVTLPERQGRGSGMHGGMHGAMHGGMHGGTHSH